MLINYFTVIPVWPVVIFGLAVLFLLYFESKRAVYYTPRLPLKQFYKFMWLKGKLPQEQVKKKKGCNLDIISAVIWVTGFIILNKNTDYLTVLEVFIGSVIFILLPWLLRRVFRLVWCFLLMLCYLGSLCFKED